MIYWIKDRVETPQKFPLNLLLSLIIRAIGSEHLQFVVTRSQGFGLQINKWGDLLDRQEDLRVERDVLEKLLEGTEEWFYHLDVKVMSSNLTVRFGLHDSTAMFIEAPRGVIDMIVNKFETVELAKEPAMKG